MRLTPDSLFADDYRVVRPLAAGGMGAVYVVEQLSTRKLRALKLMQPAIASDPEFRRRFEQEARIGARIASEHVVEVHAAGVDATTGAPYLIMELLEGEDLAHRIERAGPLPPSELVAICAQLCHALGAAHRAGVVHRDLKPENIFLANAHRADVRVTVKILDFGIAKLLAEGTSSTGAMGTPLWLAPEQTEAGTVSPAADVWALGLIAFHALTGRYFWKATDGAATIAQLMREVILDPISPASERASALRVSLPPGFDGWFSRCVARDPAARFADAAAAFDALVRLAPSPTDRDAFAATALALQSPRDPPLSGFGQTPLASAYTGPQGDSVPVTTLRTRTRAPLFVALAALALALAALAGVFVFSLRRAPATGGPLPPAAAPPLEAVAAAPSLAAAPPASVAAPLPAQAADAAVAPVAVAPAAAHKPALPPEGQLPDGVIERILRGHVSETTACYKDALRRDPDLHGRIVVRFWITHDGSVRKVVDTGSTIRDDEMRACVSHVLYKLQFPRPVGGEIPVDVPFRYDTRPRAPAEP